jgi:hypothetical protein
VGGVGPGQDTAVAGSKSGAGMGAGSGAPSSGGSGLLVVEELWRLGKELRPLVDALGLDASHDALFTAPVSKINCLRVWAFVKVTWVRAAPQVLAQFYWVKM